MLSKQVVIAIAILINYTGIALESEEASSIISDFIDLLRLDTTIPILKSKIKNEYDKAK